MAKNKETKRRVIRASKDSKAGVLLAGKEAALIGDDKSFIVVDDRGVTIKGPVSIISDASMVRKGGLFIGMPDLVRMIPSTMMTPIPPHIPMLPIGGLLRLAKDVSFFLSLLV